MDYCFSCGVSDEKTKLFDTITSEGIVKMCERCSSHSPIIKKSTAPPWRTSEKADKGTIYERSSRTRSLGPEDSLRKIPSVEKRKQEFFKRRDISLREVVERNLEAKYKKEITPRPDLVDNFNWVIMMARRAKKITVGQLAKKVGESEISIKMAEGGILPEDDYKLINKLESYLGINIIKKEFANKPRKEAPKKFGFDPISAKGLTIADLKNIKKKKEEENIDSKKRGGLARRDIDEESVPKPSSFDESEFDDRN
ncbi:MAG TPA: hypothetical protein VJH65_03815 [Candidatus Nanoarchaeia archaeon]|nr:hypothetical protein [Candidatus Nanoarchaeia archaeon]